MLAPPAVTATETAQESTEPSTETSRADEQPREAETETAPPGSSPEDQPGGAGDEEPARSQAAFTGRGGRITPRLVRVPPFISIRVELRSADGAAYALAARGRTIRVDREISSASSTFAGLRPGRRLVLRAGGGRTVAVEASAEPGP